MIRPRLLDDRAADGLDRVRPAQPGRRGLEDLELRRPRRGPLEQLGVREGDRRVRGEGGEECDVAIGPVARLARHADNAPMTRS